MKKTRMLALLMLLSALVLTALLPFAQAGAEMDVSALFINVGKADSALLFLGDERYLVDTGKSGGFDQLELALSLYGVEHLSGVFITHTDKDHVGGLKKLLKSDIQVDMIYTNRLHSEESDDEHPAYKAAKKYDVPITWLAGGEQVTTANGCVFDVLGPLGRDVLNENNNSLVMNLVTPEGNILLTGDMEQEEETELLERGLIPSATVLKVAHHGEDDSTSYQFALTVGAQWAVISTNTEDEPDTPDPKVLSYLFQARSGVAVTQEATLGIRVTLKGGVATADKLDIN